MRRRAPEAMGEGLRVFDVVLLLLQSGESASADTPLMTRLRAFGLAERLVVLRADPRLVERRLVHAALHRAAFRHALDMPARLALVIEANCLLHAEADRLFAQAEGELARRDWRSVSLGASLDDAGVARVESAQALVSGAFEGCFANGYRRETLGSFLAQMPEDAPRLADWIAREESLESFLARADGRVLVAPRIATLPHLLPYEDPALRDGFVR